MGAARRAGAGRHRFPLPALALAAAALVVVAAAVAGPPRAVPRSLRRPSPPPVATPAPPPLARALSRQHPDLTVLTTVLQVLAILLALGVAVLLVVLVVRALRGRGLPTRPRRLPVVHAAAADAVAVAAQQAEVVRRGIAYSLQQMEHERAPTDAVIRAWLGLQQTADDAGLPRRPAETPTEFTVRVLARTTADRDAAGRLLRLYLAARFGSGVTTADDVAAARDALRRLEASWSVPADGYARREA